MRGGLFAAVAAVLLLGPIQSVAAQQSSDCEQQPVRAYKGTPVKVDLPPDTAFSHKIGRQRSGEDSEQLALVTRDGVQLAAKGQSLSGEPVGGFAAAEDEGDGRIPRAQITVGVTTVGGNRLVINSCIAPEGLDPGRYTGSILVRGGEIEPVVIPVTATVQANHWLMWLLIAAVAGALGFALRTIANLAQLAERPPTAAGRSRRDLPLSRIWPAYRRDGWIFAASIVLSAVAVLGAWWGAYWSNETFGAKDLEDVGKLAGAALVAATGGTTLADLAGALKRKSA